MLSYFGHGYSWVAKDGQRTLDRPLPLDEGPGLHLIIEPIDALVEYVSSISTKPSIDL